MRLYISDALLSTNIWYPASDLNGGLQITWDPLPGKYYTLIIYDLNASKAPYVHLLITNIPGNDFEQGQQLFPFLPFAPPAGSGPHSYVIGLYEQRETFPSLNLTDRASFPIYQLPASYGLHMVESETIVIDPTTSMFYLTVSKHRVSRHPHGINILPTSQLPEDKKRFCSCVADVASKQPRACNMERAWFQMRDGHECYNPFAVCGHSVHTTSRECTENYNYDNMDTDTLVALADLENIPVTVVDKSTLVAQLKNYKRPVAMLPTSPR